MLSSWANKVKSHNSTHQQKRNFSTHPTGEFEQTIRIKNTDSQGHTNYAKGFLDTIEGSINKLNSSIKLKQQFSPSSPMLQVTNYRQQIFIGNTVKAKSEVVSDHGGNISLKSELYSGNQLTATSYSVYTDTKTAHDNVNPEYIPLVNGYETPAKRPQNILGYEITLTEDESTISKGQVGTDGQVNPNKMFELLHTFGYEKGIMEGTGEGFETKNSKPVMAESSVVYYRSLKEGDKFSVYIITNFDPKNPSRYEWTGTLVNNVNGEICAIAQCKHVLLGLDGKPKQKKEINPLFIDKLIHYKNPLHQYDLFEKGILAANKNIKVRIGNDITKATINLKSQQNVIAGKFLTELHAACSYADKHTMPLLIQSGQSNFVLGANVQDFLALSNQKELIEFSSIGQQALQHLCETPNTTAALNGFVLGGGAELALAAKHRIATPDTKLGLVETKIGVLPAFDGCRMLRDLIGLKHATRMIVSGQILTAQQAQQLGIIDHIFTKSDEIDKFAHLTESQALYQSRLINKKFSEPKPYCASEQEIEWLHGIIKQLKSNKDQQLLFAQRLHYAWEISHDQFTNINKWIEAVHNARIKAVKVLIEQSKSNLQGNIEAQQKIESQAFAELASTPEAKFAMDFWLIGKKWYLTEHKTIEKYQTLGQSGIEIDFKELVTQKGNGLAA